jgi:hypothetical protein
MALDFPSSASVGQIYTGTNGVLYTYDGIRWRASSAAETDPVYTTGTASSITSNNISNWNSAYGWGNHALRGYLTATISSHVLPTSNLTYDLGSTSSQWRSLYVGTSTIYIGGTALSVSNGNLTLNGSQVTGAPVTTSTLVNGTAKLELIIGGAPYVLFPDFEGGQIYVQGNEIAAVDTSTLVLSAGSGGQGNIHINTYNPFPNTWVFGNNGALTLPNNVVFKDNSLGSFSLGSGAGLINQSGNSIAVGNNAGENTQSAAAIAIGFRAGRITQGTGSVALGLNAGTTNQGSYAVSVGVGSGYTNQSTSSVAVGNNAGYQDQGLQTVAIGNLAGAYSQGQRAVAVGSLAGSSYQGQYAVAIGNFAGASNQPANSIVINASGSALDGSSAGLFIDPIRADTSGNTTTSLLYYNPATKEVTTSSSGIVKFPDGTTSTGASVYVPYATSSSYKITTEIDMLGSYLPLTFEVIGDTIKLPSGNGLIQSGDFLNAWSLDSLNKSFTFPNNSDIEYGDGTYLSTGSLRVRVDFGGEFKIFLGEPNKTWTFNNSGNIVFPNGTEQATAFTGTNVITGTNDNFVISINTGTLTVRNQFTDSVVISSLGITGAINYVPTNPADWTGSPTVGTVSSAIDELAYRTTTLEAAGGGGGGTSDITDVWMYNSNGNFGVAANTVTLVPFDNTSGTGNIGTDWNTASGFNRLAPTLGGWYDITCHIQWSGSWSANVSLMVYKNGNLYKNIGSSWIGQGGQQYGSCLVYLNGTGDYADIRVNQGSGGFQFIEPGISKTWVQALWVKG